MTPGEAHVKYEDMLTNYEKSELSRFQYIYTVGSVRVHNRSQISDGKSGLYRFAPGEQIGYRYQVESSIDAGSFGQVLKCLDMRENGNPVAIKISRDKN